jgi:hypothetical protein
VDHGTPIAEIGRGPERERICMETIVPSKRPRIEEEHELTIDRSSVTAAWWTPDIGGILCALCGDCQGWRSPERPISCVAGNPWCG